jgi:membrane protein implicated in regulation of membrane protease activity
MWEVQPMVQRRTAIENGSRHARVVAAPVLTVLAVLVLLAAVVVLGLAILISARRTLFAAGRRPAYGPETLVGAMGTVREPLAPIGQVLVDGSLWRARETWGEPDAAPIPDGDRVVVERVDGLTLLVRPAETWEVEA